MNAKFFVLATLLFTHFSVLAETNSIDKPAPTVSDFAITYTGKAIHLGSSGKNENNRIFGLRYKSYEIATMINSFHNRSYMVSYHKKWPMNDWIDLGVRLGGMTGYSKEDNKYQIAGISPLFAPTLDLHYGHLGVEFSLTNIDVLVVKLNVSF